MYAPGSDWRMRAASSQVRVRVRAPTARLTMLPPNTSTASGPNMSAISSAFLDAPSTAATMTVSEAMPSDTAAMTKKLRSR